MKEKQLIKEFANLRQNKEKDAFMREILDDYKPE
jgi:hypothetical protein